MEHIQKIEKKVGVDIGWNSFNMYPEDGEGRKGKQGFDETLTFERMLGIAYRMNPRPNIMIKGGLNAKWYLKYFPEELIEHEIGITTKWKKNIPHNKLYIITWDDYDPLVESYKRDDNERVRFLIETGAEVSNELVMQMLNKTLIQK